MGRSEKLIGKILSGHADGNISFRELRQLLKKLGFVERIKGDHHIFVKDGVAEILNLQPIGSKAKAYQVKQVRAVILNHGLESEQA